MISYFVPNPKPLHGRITIPGDKSISHRAVILASMAVGRSMVSHLLESQDVLASIAAMRKLGATIEKKNERWQIEGVGVLGFVQPDDVIDMGNSGTSVRLIMGAVGAHPIEALFTGDESLRKRPMARIAAPLAQGGVQCRLREGCYLPLAVKGSELSLPIDYESPVASAQIKSALLLYGLNVNGRTRIIEPLPSRDHSEIMLKAFGAHIACHDMPDGKRSVSIDGVQALHGIDIDVPGDISSAAFLIVAALITPKSDVTLTDIGLNPTRTGFLEILLRMGADIRIKNESVRHGEKRGDLCLRHSQLKGVEVESEIAPRMIDEYPALAVAASFAQGQTMMRGLKELRLKESDRIAAICDGLEMAGVIWEAGDDWLLVKGSAHNGKVRGLKHDNHAIAAAHDHRIAMSFLVMGLQSQNPIRVDETESIATSFPNFFETMQAVGAQYG